MAYKVINIKDIYNSLGEKETKEILKNYECKLNDDVEYFFKEKAVEFSKQDIAETFIVLAPYKGNEVIVGYFAITNKGINIKKTLLSKTKRKSLLRYSRYDSESNSYHIALPPIGQLGKIIMMDITI